MYVHHSKSLVMALEIPSSTSVLFQNLIPPQRRRVEANVTALSYYGCSVCVLIATWLPIIDVVYGKYSYCTSSDMPLSDLEMSSLSRAARSYPSIFKPRRNKHILPMDTKRISYICM